MCWEVVVIASLLTRMTKQKALAIVLITALVLMLLIGLRFLLNQSDSSTLEGRTAFLRRLGWEIDAGSEEHRIVRLPEVPGEVLERYNRMQKAQGYDLFRHLGERCEIYSYRLTNYPDCGQTVMVTLYVQGRRIIGGDIHSTALDGFMHGLKTR